MSADPKCPQCYGLGIVSRCRSGAFCVCAVIDCGVACAQGISYPCLCCKSEVKQNENTDEPAHIS